MSVLTLKQKSQQEVFDNLYTPKGVVAPVTKLVPFLSNLTIWECCDTPTKSFITQDLETLGFRVVSSGHELDGVDFLESSTPAGVDFVLTNPPFSQKDLFIKSLIKRIKQNEVVGGGFLLPTTALSGQRRHQMYKDAMANHIEITALMFPKRIDFTGKGACWFDVCWLLFRKTESETNFIRTILI